MINVAINIFYLMILSVPPFYIQDYYSRYESIKVIFLLAIFTVYSVYFRKVCLEVK